MNKIILLFLSLTTLTIISCGSDFGQCETCMNDQLGITVEVCNNGMNVDIVTNGGDPETINNVDYQGYIETLEASDYICE